MASGGKRSDAAARLLRDDSPEAMLAIDTRTLRFLEVNQAAIDQYGFSRQEFLTMQVAEILAPQDRSRILESLKQNPIDPAGFQDVHHVLKDGRIVEIDMHAHPIRYLGKKALLITVYDCARRKQLEEQLRQAQKMEAVGMLAGGIAHDFNNLLTIITGYSQMVLGNLPENDENRGSVEQIMKAGDRAADLTRQLLTFSRRQVVRPKVLELNAIVAGAAVMLRRLIGEHIELRIVAAPDLAKIHADPGQLEQVIMNLAVNSRDAMPYGGSLILETQNVRLDDPIIGPRATLKPGSYVMLAVTDTGSGMDARTRSHLFEPFFTTKAQGQGTGLGLSTVHGIVKQSGGEIVIHSETGQGTCVKIYFPAVTETAADERPSGLLDKVTSGSETILLAEDEEAVRRLVRRNLEKRGYQLLVASSGPEALKLAEQHPGPIHLLIADVVMPQMSGRQLAEWLRASRPNVRVLYISGYTEAAVTRTGNLGAGEGFLQKPFTPSILARRVRELLDAANGKPEAPITESLGK